MSDFSDRLDAEARRVRGGPNALEIVLRRAERRRRARRIASGVLALAIAAGGIGLAYAAFRPGQDTRPGGQPAPGPSPSPGEVIPAPSRVTLLNGTRTDGAAEVAALILRDQAAGTSDLIILGGRGQPSDITRIFCHPNVEEEALRIRDALFPGAEINGSIHPGEIRIVVGEDFARENAGAIEAFRVVSSFMEHRLAGSGAERFLHRGAAPLYESGEGGLSLYEYTGGGKDFSITGMGRAEAGYSVVVRISTEGSESLVHETLIVGVVDHPNGTSEVLVLGAERNE